ncbi:MAG: helix-turn-helix domain-containing protein [Marmoricola sp.]
MALTSVAVILQPQAAVFEFGVVHEVFALDRTGDGVPAFDFRVCVEEPDKPLPMVGGFGLTGTQGLEAVEDADLVVAAAFQFGTDPSPRVIETVQNARRRGARILSVCSGAFLLGAAGLLDDRDCTTHWRYAAELQRRHPKARVDPNVLFIDQDGIITSAGTSAGIDACLHLVRTEFGADVATAIARRMVVPPQRDGGQRQYVATPVPACTAESLQPMLDWVLANLAEPHSVRTMAQRASMSERTFARRFAAETGTTPARWLLQQRLHNARVLLERTDLSIDAIAGRCGFGSAALLRHHFTGEVGVPPATYRRTFNLAS